MRKLKNLNYIEIVINDIKDRPKELEHIELESFDIANSQPSEDLYLLFLDLVGYIIISDYKFEFSFSIDMFSDKELDLKVENIIDLVEVEQIIKEKFSDKDSELRKLIENQINYLFSNLNCEIDLR